MAPGLLKRDTPTMNKDARTALHDAAPANAASAHLFANKENFFPSIAEGRKQSRRAATKMFSGVSPSKIRSNSTSRTNSSDMTTITVVPAPLAGRGSLNGSLEPPRKRPRYLNDARAPPQPTVDSPTQGSGQTTSPQRQAGNIAGLVHDETLEMNITNPRRSPSITFQMLSPKQFGSPLGPAHQAHRSPPSFTSLVNQKQLQNSISSAHVQPPPLLVRTSVPKSDVGQPHCSTFPPRYPMQPDVPLFRGDQPPTYPALAIKPQSKSWNPFLDERLDHGPQNAYQQMREETPSYPPLHMQPTQSYQQPQVENTLSGGSSEPVPKNDTGPGTYPSFVPQASHSFTPIEMVPSQFSAQTKSTSIERYQAAPTHEDARQPYAKPPSQLKPKSTPHLDILSRASSSDATESSASDGESQSVSASKTTPPSSVDSLSNDTQMNGTQNRLSLHPQPVRTSQILKDDKDGVLRTLSERSYLDLSSEHKQGTMNPASGNLDDSTFVTRVLAHLDHQRQLKTQTFGRRQAARIHQVLSVARPPNNTEALFLSGNEAARYLEPNCFFPGVIVTQDQQPRPLQSTTEFLNEFYDDSARVFVQNPSVQASDKKSAAPQRVTIGKLKERFLQDRKLQKKNQPWNCLELATHVEDGLRPAFLAGEDGRLLTKLKLPSSEDTAGRRGYDPGWKEVEKWALLAQAGALTEPHQDSHGYNTYITVNQGVIGFGWLANPTAEERAQWRHGPHAFTGGQWRYVILRPGQTVYFPSGTVHFVFRLAAAGDTLAFGGHVLRCSQIVRWIKTLVEEQADPDVTNEDLTVSAPAYLDRVEKFVRQALKDGRMDIWGGKESIEEFLFLKKQFEKNKG